MTEIPVQLTATVTVDPDLITRLTGALDQGYDDREASREYTETADTARDALAFLLSHAAAGALDLRISIAPAGEMEEARERLLERFAELTEYWAGQEDHDPRARLQGLTYSLLTALDDEWAVRPCTGEDDDPGIAGALHESWHATLDSLDIARGRGPGG